LQQTGAAPGSGTAGRIEIFEYPAGPDASLAPDWNGWPELSGVAPPAEPAHGHSRRDLDAAAGAAFEERLAEERRGAFEAGRERGRQEGRQGEREAQAAQQAAADERMKRQIAELIERFAEERERYLHAVEPEVVRLALAVAARILRREAQMDPLLLTGAVRVALGQLSDSTEVRLRVPAGELELWTEAIALLPNLAVTPEVAAGDGMRLGDCAIETRLGTVDLGIRAQLAEIERGFFDRAGVRRIEPLEPCGQAPAPERENDS
jgi:flagellar assembly protein FliH